MPLATVIMRSKNSAGVVEQALAGLFSQRFKDFVLIVVDSGSTDATLETVRAYPCRVIQIEPGDYYPGAVLNSAIEQTSTDLIVFQNSDSVPLGPDSLGRLIAAFDDPETAAAFGRQLPRPEAHGWVRRDYSMAFPGEGPAPAWQPFSLPLAAMRRSAWKKHPFYTWAWGSEDTEWGSWARANGLRIRYVADAAVMHSHNYTLRQLYGRRFIEGEADAYIEGKPLSFTAFTLRLLGSTANDAVWHLKKTDWTGLLAIPARRFVYHWAYWKGRRWGRRRLRTHDADSGTGQKIVLDRHE